jgi:hypothetical protein
MIDAQIVVPACEASLKSGPAASNAAIGACCNAFLRTFRAVRAADNEFHAKLAAITSYSAALPALSGAENIRDFIACVAHGLLLGIIDEAKAARLLYAAQVARNAHAQPPLRRDSAPQPKPAP